MPLIQDLLKKMKGLKRKKKLSKEAQAELDKIEEEAYLEAAKESAKELGKKKAKEDFELK